MYYAPSDLTGVDRLTFNGYIRPDGGEVFDLPFDQDVTVIAEIPDPRDPTQVYTAFNGTVPAGSVSSRATKYRYLARDPGDQRAGLTKGDGLQDLRLPVHRRD